MKTIKVKLSNIYGNMSDSYIKKETRKSLKSYMWNMAFTYYPETKEFTSSDPCEDEIEGEDYFIVTIKKVGYQYLTFHVA